MADLDFNTNSYDHVAEAIIDMGNRILDEDDSADVWEVASGILAGAIQFWLFSRQPCADPFCQACVEISTVERRLAALIDESQKLAEDSDYCEPSHEGMVGTA